MHRGRNSSHGRTVIQVYGNDDTVESMADVPREGAGCTDTLYLRLVLTEYNHDCIGRLAVEVLSGKSKSCDLTDTLTGNVAAITLARGAKHPVFSRDLRETNEDYLLT